MPTKQFLEQYEEAKEKNKLFTWEEKRELFKLLTYDYGDGEGIHGYRPHEAQIGFHKSKARVRVFVGGNRLGKSLAGGAEGSIAVSRFGTRIWVIGETYDICDREWEYIEHFLTKSNLWHKRIKPEIERQMSEAGIDNKSPDSFMRVLNYHPKTIEINWPTRQKSMITQKQFGRRSSGGTSLEGEKLSGVIWAEGSRVPNDIVEQHIDKRLSDRWGWMTLAVTAKGTDEFLKASYMKGASEVLSVDIDRGSKTVSVDKKALKKSRYHIDKTTSYWESYETWHVPAYESPHYNQETYEADKRKLFNEELDEATFKERNFGTFESMSGVFYKGVKWDDILVQAEPIPSGATHYCSLDPGRGGAFSCLWAYVTSDGQVVFYDELYLEGEWIKSFVPKIHEKTNHTIKYYTGDPSTKKKTHHTKDTVAQTLRGLGITPYYLPENMPTDTVTRLNYWKQRLYNGEIKIWEKYCPNLIHEMKILEWGEKMYSGGHTTRRNKLAKSPMHALDCATYLFYTNPKHDKRPEPEVAETPEGSVFNYTEDDPHPDSFAFALKEVQKSNRKAKIGIW